MKNPQENIIKLNPRMYKKNYTPHQVLFGPGMWDQFKSKISYCNPSYQQAEKKNHIIIPIKSRNSIW